jgi:hypothetical protein
MTFATVSLSFTDAQLTAIDAALAELETQFAALVGLTADQRKSLTKMGSKSEAFCRQTMSLLGQNPQLVPPSVPVARMQETFDALDDMRPRWQRLERLYERIADTDMAAGAAIMQTALQGYALLKVSGRNQGLESLRETIGTRFARKPKAPEAKAA